MTEIDDIFKENVRNSFKKAREDYFDLKNEVKSQKNIISKLNELLGLLTTKFEEFSIKMDKKEENKPYFFNSSIGNEGVQSLTQQSLSTQHTIPPDFTDLKQLEKAFRSLTRQEFLIFLSIYQLEEDKGSPITYEDLKSQTKLSLSGIRSYVSVLIGRGLPLKKVLINNRVVSLSIPKSFRTLDLKSKLLSLYQKKDTNQTRLTL